MISLCRLYLVYNSNMRKLTKQQQYKIATNQAAQLGDAALGLVIAHYGDNVEIETADNVILRCNLRQNLPAIVVGDRVAWQIENSENKLGVVTALQPRETTMLRRDQKGKQKIIAANVDQILIVAAPEPKRSEQVIDRYLIMTELQRIKAGVVINKIDKLTDNEIVEKHESLIRFKHLGYPVLYVSSTAHQGFEELREVLKHKTTVFVGLSGVGKSSIIQALLPEQALAVGGLSEQGQQGQHTTTTARLYHLAEGGNIIDSPGIREFALEGLTADEILQGFIEIRELATGCKFRDCQHQQEPGCAVLGAIEKGLIHPLRLKAYLSAS